MLETIINVVFKIQDHQLRSLFESLILHLRMNGINVMPDGRTAAWEGSTLQGINIFLQESYDLEKAAKTIRNFLTTQLNELHFCSWTSDGRDVKVIIRGVINYNENPLRQSALEYIIE